MHREPRDRDDPTAQAYRPGPHYAAVVAAALTLPLLFVGGSVTSYGVGLAVPDWPTTFGVNMFLYNFWNEPFGVRLEHSHRLFGSAVGLATVVLAGWLLTAERRRGVKALGVVALVAVIIQGVMGGLRVNQISTTLAAVHGGFAQAFFGLLVVLCVLTGRGWQSETPGGGGADPARLRAWSLAMVGLVYGQVAVGAWFRHLNKGAAAASVHATLGLVVLGLAHALAGRVRRNRETAGPLAPSAKAVAVAATVQVGLGLLALWLMLPLGGNPRTPTLWQAMTRTAHQTNGAVLLAATVVLAVRARRHFGAAPAALRNEPAPRAVEALA